MIKRIAIGLTLLSLMAVADTPPPGTVKAKMYTGNGTTAITSTGAAGALDVNLTNSLSVSNPANGNTGSSVPVQATQTGGVDGSGNLRAFKVSTTGVISVDGSAVTQPVSAASLPLPTGAATAANQTSSQGSAGGGTAAANSLLMGGVYNTAAPTLTNGQQASLQFDSSGNLKTNGTSTISGTVAATQSGTWNITNVSGTVSLPTGASTAAKQPALGTAGSASSDVLTVQGIASMTALKTDSSAVTQPISASSLPLPTGASTSALQTTGNTSLSTIATNTGNIPANLTVTSNALQVTQTTATPAGTNLIGKVGIDQTTPGTTNGVQVNAALPAGSNVIGHVINDASSAVIGHVINDASSAVIGHVIADSGSTTVVTGTPTVNLTQVGSSNVSLGQTTGASSIPVVTASDIALSTGAVRTATGNLTATSQTVTINTSGATTILFMPTGTFSATVTFETTGDGGTTWQSIQSWDYANAGLTNTANVSGRIYAIPALGNTIRARCSTYASGTMVANFAATNGAFPAAYVSPVAFFPIQGNVAEGATATNTNPVLVGGVFQTSPATITNGQQAYLQTDNTQNLLVKVNTALPAGTNAIGTVTAKAGTPTALTVKAAAVTIGTSAVRLTNDGLAAASTRVLLVAQLLSTSTANCFMGPSTVTSSGATRGIQMFPGQTFSFTNDAGDYYAICDAATQTFYITEQE